MSKILAAYALREARLGHLGPLIGRLRFGALTRDEREFIAGMLEKLDGKRGKAMLRGTEALRISEQVKELRQELGSTEAAVTEVAKAKGLKRSSIFAAIKEAKTFWVPLKTGESKKI
jgi:hypothetical protein